ncbi:uncharacterized protein LOC131293856 [Anopheles ziemanni]|uniref:uncharacterized protein LOC131293856 n=1 Tax=Anopheles ziemanni TaxID=345580 RepID=UPI00265D8D67|nr:uncharacterized protein LOC131293856 [Anopheles ziemanni]
MSGTESKRLYARQDVEQSLRLISAVEKRPVVYNKKLKHYKNKVSQNDAWSSIAVEVDMPVAEAKRLWQNLLGSYRSYRSKVRQSTQTGAAHSEVYRPKWFAYEAMAFLGNVLEDDGHVDTLDEHDEDLALHSLNPSAPPANPTPTSPPDSFDDHCSMLPIDPPQSLSDNLSPCPGPSNRLSSLPSSFPSTSLDDTPPPSIPARTPANHQRKRRRINEGSEVNEVLKELMEATVANANSPENTFGRWVAEFLRRFTPEEQQEVTSRIQRAMLEAEDDVKAKRQAM